MPTFCKMWAKMHCIYFSHIDELDDDFGPLLRSTSTQHHTLDPLS